MAEPTPAGWYPDPENPGQQRYWDGTAWAEHFAPGDTPAAPAAAVAKKPIYRRAWFIVVAVLIGLGVLSSVIGGGQPEDSASAPPVSESTSQSEQDDAEAPAVEPEPEAEPAPTQPALTMGQQQAVSKGESYLDLAGFSRQGLIDQLVYEGFSEADATFAVDRIAPDWKQEAVEKAQSYLDMAGFSRKGLIEQLVYEEFSEDEATFAVDQIDPDWNEEAAEKAQSYIDMTSFSRQGLIDQLVYEGFSSAEAEYGVQAVGY